MTQRSNHPWKNLYNSSLKTLQAAAKSSPSPTPKKNLTKAETDAAMQKIVAANVFNTIGGDLVQAVEARVVNRNVQVLA